MDSNGPGPQQGTWSREDPRWHVGKRADIIVEIDKHIYEGHVDTKHVYCVFLSERLIDKNNCIGEEDDWPGWNWTWWPSE